MVYNIKMFEVGENFLIMWDIKKDKKIKRVICYF